MRALPRAVGGPFDAVVSFDNAIPHLLEDEDLDAAAASVRAVLRPGGVFAASMRDYEPGSPSGSGYYQPVVSARAPA